MNEQQTVYIIPENYGGTVKILQGSIRLRFLLDAIGLTLLGLTLAYFLHPLFSQFDREARIGWIVVLVSPGGILGLTGIGGESVSTLLKAMLRWQTERCQLIYDPVPGRFASSPIECAEQQAKERELRKTDAQRFLRRFYPKRHSLLELPRESLQIAPDPSLKPYETDKSESLRIPEIKRKHEEE